MSFTKYGMLLRFLGNGIYADGMDIYPRVNLLNSIFSPVSAAFRIIYHGKEKPYKLYVTNHKYFMIIFGRRP